MALFPGDFGRQDLERYFYKYLGRCDLKRNIIS